MNDIIESDNFWNELVYNVCKGNATEMRTLNEYDIFDFFSFIENREKENNLRKK